MLVVWAFVILDTTVKRVQIHHASLNVVVPEYIVLVVVHNHFQFIRASTAVTQVSQQARLLSGILIIVRAVLSCLASLDISVAVVSSNLVALVRMDGATV